MGLEQKILSIRMAMKIGVLEWIIQSVWRFLLLSGLVTQTELID